VVTILNAMWLDFSKLKKEKRDEIPQGKNKISLHPCSHI
jgi:hypothetical protein